MGVSISPLHVRRGLWMAASASQIWQEFETMHRLSAWFGRGHELVYFEPVLGGRIELSVVVDDEVRPFGGQVIVWEPGCEMTFEDNWHPPHQWPVPTLITLRLVPMYEGTLVELFHHGFERLGASAGAELEAYETGWSVHHLSALKEIVEG